jgi:hypothetical protein
MQECPTVKLKSGQHGSKSEGEVGKKHDVESERESKYDQRRSFLEPGRLDTEGLVRLPVLALMFCGGKKCVEQRGISFLPPGSREGRKRKVYLANSSEPDDI